jgi:hypothetical protein
MTLSFIALLTGKIPVSGMSVMFIAVGLCCAYQIIAIYKASTYVDENVVGLTTAVANMIIMIFGYIFHSIIGFIINTMGGPTSTLAFMNGIAVIPIALVVGIVGLFLISIKDVSIKKV